MKSLNEDATSKIQINGHCSRPIQIRSSIRQGCPLNVILFSLTLNSLVYRLSRHINGRQINAGQTHMMVTA